MPGLIDPGALTGTERAVCIAFGAGDRIDVSRRADRQVRAEVLAALLTGGYPEFTDGLARLDLLGAVITGRLDLAGAKIDAVAAFSGCRFQRPPRLEMTELVGLSLRGCTLPGLHARNVRLGSDLSMESGFTSTGVVDLTDATVNGTVRLSGAQLHSRSGTALLAARIHASGSIQATGMSTRGEVRLRGAQVGGSLHLTAARLANPKGEALDATGLTITGNLHCDGGADGFDAAGRVVLAGARVGGDAVFSGAYLHDARATDGQVMVTPRGTPDEMVVLDADRLRVDGDVRLDNGFVADGVVGLRGVHVGGHLILSGATVGRRDAVAHLSAAFAAGKAVESVPVAVVADGAEIGGDLEARSSARMRHRDGDPHQALRAYGQVRLVDATVHGSASLSRARLIGPAIDVLFADRLRVGGTLFLRRLRARGSIRLQNAHIGSSLDCSGAHLRHPRLREDGTVKPSLDARAVTVGKDLLCSDGFRATGGVRVLMAEVGKMVSFRDARLGGRTGPDHPRTSVALNAYGLVAHELALTFAPHRPPLGTVYLTRAEVVLVVDGPALWAATGGVLIEDFVYQAIVAKPEVGVQTRLAWLREIQPDFAPGPYEQLIHVYSAGGNEELARRVQVERQRRRYAELGPAGRLWGFLQEWTVGYGYRPWLAIVWLLVFWLLGALWFTANMMQKLDVDQNPVWNPPLLATDLLLPIVDLGQDNMWRMVGPSQWIAGVLIAVGWILASTAAAGAARVLKRG